MTRNIFIFLSTFVAGGLIALVARAAFFKPPSGHEDHPAAGGDYAAMVSNPLSPAAPPAPKHGAASITPSATPRAAADPHAGHNAASTSAPTAPSATPAAPTANVVATEAGAAAANQPVNTLCAICGMEVDPTLPTAQYQGKTIGFGCRMCPPKFKAEPDRYGPLYLKNEVIKR